MKFRLFLLPALWLLFVTGCQKKPDAVAPASPTPTPTDPHATRIGFFVPQTGAQSSFGADATKGAILAEKEINAAGGVFGHPLKLIIVDTKSNPEETAKAVKELIEKDHVVALVGEIATDRSLVAAPIAQAAGIPMITPASTHEAVTATGDFIFRACYTDAFQARAMSEFAWSIDANKAAILYDASNPYGMELAGIFQKDFEAHAGAKIVAQQTYRAGDTDFTNQLNALKAAGPEVIFLPSYYKEAALIISQARQLGIDIPFLGADGWDSPEFLHAGGSAVNNCYFSSHFSAESPAPRAESFVKDYLAAYNEPPPPLAALTYDSVNLVVAALKSAGVAEPVPLKTALAATKDFDGVTGTITFDEKRNPTKPDLIIRVQNGKFTYLETVSPK